MISQPTLESAAKELGLGIRKPEDLKKIFRFIGERSLIANAFEDIHECFTDLNQDSEAEHGAIPDFIQQAAQRAYHREVESLLNKSTQELIEEFKDYIFDMTETDTNDFKHHF